MGRDARSSSGCFEPISLESDLSSSGWVKQAKMTAPTPSVSAGPLLRDNMLKFTMHTIFNAMIMNCDSMTIPSVCALLEVLQRKKHKGGFGMLDTSSVITE